MCGCRQSFTFAYVLPLPVDRTFWFVVHHESFRRFFLCRDLGIRLYDFSILCENLQSSAITSQSGKFPISAQTGNYFSQHLREQFIEFLLLLDTEIR